MNAQEVFTAVKNHLLAQRKQALDVDGNCMYRGDNGTKCAVGCLIPDNLYDPAMEHIGAAEYVDEYTEDHRKVGIRLLQNALNHLGLSEHGGLLRDLQDCHDSVSPSYWEEELQIIAEKYGLNYA